MLLRTGVRGDAEGVVARRAVWGVCFGGKAESRLEGFGGSVEIKLEARG